MMRTSQRKNNFVRLLMTGLMVFSLMLASAACKKETAAPPPPPPASKAVQPKMAVQKPVSSLKVEPAQATQIDFGNLRDPFKSFIEVKVETPEEAAKKKASLTSTLPLYSYEIQQFKVIGIILDPKGNRALDKAMLKAPDGKGYVVKVGMKIGKNESRIAAIDKAGVHVLVQYTDENKIKHNEKETIPLLRKP